MWPIVCSSPWRPSWTLDALDLAMHHCVYAVGVLQTVLCRQQIPVSKRINASEHGFLPTQRLPTHQMERNQGQQRRLASALQGYMVKLSRRYRPCSLEVSDKNTAVGLALLRHLCTQGKLFVGSGSCCPGPAQPASWAGCPVSASRRALCDSATSALRGLAECLCGTWS